MGWQQYVRAMEAANRQIERAAAKNYRQWAQEQGRLQKEEAKRDAAREVVQYEAYIALLTTMHAECGPTFDWSSVLRMPAPVMPQPVARREPGARAALVAFQPGLFSRVLGGASKVRAELESQLGKAIAEDQHEYTMALAAYQRDRIFLERATPIAHGVLKLELQSCRNALEFTHAFEELVAFQSVLSLDTIDGDVGVISCAIRDEEIVPREEIKLTASGKRSSKDMAAGKYWALYQDHVCSCAIRIARETLAALPLRRVIVNVKALRLDSSTGHKIADPILAVHFIRDVLERLKFDAIDPSDALKNFPHKMKFKKTSGFDRVDEMTSDEQWVST